MTVTRPKTYNAISDWVAKEYGLNADDFVRPFYPGGDYQNFDYNGKIVVDNPPFSIFSQIIKFYIENHIKFFLFAPTLTLFSGASELCTALPIGTTVTYENGAQVNTSFVTNLDPIDVRIRTVPKLYRIVNKANSENLKAQHKQLPKYSYPPYVITATQLCRYSKAGLEIVIPCSESAKVGALDSQKALGKAIFGDGYLVSERCREMIEKAEREKAEREKAEREKAERWQLSDREIEIIDSLKK